MSHGRGVAAKLRNPEPCLRGKESAFGGSLPAVAVLDPFHFLGNFVDALLDRFDVRMQLAQDRVFFMGNVFDSLPLFSELLEHRILSGRNAMHPPETNDPAAEPGDVREIENETGHIQARSRRRFLLIRAEPAAWR